MARLMRSHQSEIDVYEIAAFIAPDNLPAACALIDRIEETLVMLSEFPLAGLARPDL